MRKIRKLLNTQGALTQLKRALEQQQSLVEQVRACLPPPLKEQLQAAILNGRSLTLLVHSPVWASRLRYQAPQLLRQLRQQGLVVEQLRPRIIPAVKERHPTRRRQIGALSASSAESLRQVANSLETGPLQEALRRLSRHQK